MFMLDFKSKETFKLLCHEIDASLFYKNVFISFLSEVAPMLTLMLGEITFVEKLETIVHNLQRMFYACFIVIMQSTCQQ